jgi:hypothetical protein
MLVTRVEESQDIGKSSQVVEAFDLGDSREEAFDLGYSREGRVSYVDSIESTFKILILLT